MTPVSQSTLEVVRKLLCQGFPVARIAMEVEKRLSSAGEHPQCSRRDVVEVFRQAFSLTISDTMPLRGWRREDGTIDDTQLNTLMLPRIVRARDRWIGLAGGNVSWIEKIDLTLGERADDRPTSISITLWEKLTADEQTELRLMHDRAAETRLQSVCLAAQVQRIAENIPSS